MDASQALPRSFEAPPTYDFNTLVPTPNKRRRLENYLPSTDVATNFGAQLQQEMNRIAERRQPLQGDTTYNLADSVGGTNTTYKWSYKIGRYFNNHNIYDVGTILFNNLKKDPTGSSEKISVASTCVMNYYFEEGVRENVFLPKSQARRRSFRQKFLYANDVDDAVKTWGGPMGAVDSPLYIQTTTNSGSIVEGITRPRLPVQVGGMVTVKNQFGVNVGSGQQCFYIYTMGPSPYPTFLDWNGNSMKRCSNENVDIVQIFGVCDSNLDWIPWNTSSNYERPTLFDSDYIARNKRLKATYSIIEATENGGFVKRDTEIPDVPDIIAESLYGCGFVIKVGTTKTSSKSVTQEAYMTSQRSLLQLQSMPTMKIFWGW